MPRECISKVLTTNTYCFCSDLLIWCIPMNFTTHKTFKQHKIKQLTT